MKTRRLLASRDDASAVVAPYFSLARALWIPAVYVEGAETSELRRVDGPEGFSDYGRAVEASRFLARQENG